MFRNAALPRATSALRPTIAQSSVRCSCRRFVSTAPPTQKSRSWKSLFARWGLAGGAIYYYNTSPVFQEEPLSNYTLRPDPQDEASSLETLESVVSASASRRNNSVLASVASSTRPVSETAPRADTASASQDPAVNFTKEDKKAQGSEEGSDKDESSSQLQAGNAEALQEEAGQEGAFNPETGEINWDCPCLGGMAHGPCGEEFKAAFSCFVYSNEEPKGIECIDKFKGMQDCFRLHPDVYGAELEDDEEGSPTPADGDEESLSVTARAKAEAAKQTAEEEQKKASSSEELVPKAAHDAK